MVASPLSEPLALSAVDLPGESWDGWLLTQLGSVLDGTALGAMRVVIDAVLMPRPEELPAQRAAAARFLEGELQAEPRRFFSFIDTPVTPVRVTSRPRRSLRGGSVVSRRFTTAYQPYHSIEGTDAGAAPPADRVLVEHWMHEDDPPAATVLALHGFSMGYPRIDAFALFAAQWFSRGFDVALLTLPFHGPRTPPGARFSGERFAVPNVAQLNEAVRQAIYEIHMVSGWLRQETAAPVGLLGLSLGGYLSALMAGLTPDLAFVIPMVPPVCIGDLAWRFFSRSRYYRSAQSAAFSCEELRAIYRVHSPLTYSPRVDKRRLLIVAGRGDRIVPPEHPHALWCHWDRPDIHWFSGSHLAPFRRGRLVKRIFDHLQGLDRKAG
jgi:dienelactone hydrolase